MKPMLSYRGLLLLALFFGTSLRATAQVYDLAANFSLASNPNGDWSYGSTGTTLTGSFTSFTNSSSALGGNSNVNAWTGTEFIGINYPLWERTFLVRRRTPAVGSFRFFRGNCTCIPRQPATTAWPASPRRVAGQYQLNTVFQGRDTRGATSDVHILLNGVVNGFDMASNQSYSGLQTLSVGDRLDFAVGYGPNSTYDNDSTALVATISAVPESSAWLLIGLASVAGITIYGRKRRKREIRID